MATPTPTIPVTVDTFQIARRFEGPKVTTVTGMATPTPTIPVTVDTFHIARGSKGPKVTTVTGMASTQPLPPKKKQVTKEKKKKTSQKNKTPPVLYSFAGVLLSCAHSTGLKPSRKFRGPVQEFPRTRGPFVLDPSNNKHFDIRGLGTHIHTGILGSPVCGLTHLDIKILAFTCLNLERKLARPNLSQLP